MPQGKQLTGQGHSPSHQQTGCLKTSLSPQAPLDTPPTSAHQRAQDQLHPQVGKPTPESPGAQPGTPGSLPEPLVQLQPPGSRHHVQENPNPTACWLSWLASRPDSALGPVGPWFYLQVNTSFKTPQTRFSTLSETGIPSLQPDSRTPLHPPVGWH